MSKICNVLFVCTGNSCRSVMAEYYFRKCAQEKGLDFLRASSAGVSGLVGLRASAETQMILEQHGISALKHRSGALTMKELSEADYIFAMEEYHHKHILSMAPEFKQKVHLLSTFGRLTPTPKNEINITDPIGQSMDFYEECFDIIKEYIDRAIGVLSLSIAIGADHGGFVLKEELKELLTGVGYRVKDFGTYSKDSCDYPLIGQKVAKAVAENAHQRGILICKSGVGMTIVANKVPGVRAGVCDSVAIARSSREHNDCNVCVFGAERPEHDSKDEILQAWLASEHLGDRHKRRVDQICSMEKERQPKI